MKIKKQLSRKEIRKQKKLEKKQKIKKHHERKSSKPNQPPAQQSLSKSNIYFNPSHSQLKKTHNKAQKKERQGQKASNLEFQQQFSQQEEQIKMYEKKLGIKGDGKKYGSLAKKMGFDDDLFSFLDNISKKVHKNAADYQNIPESQYSNSQGFDMQNQEREQQCSQQNQNLAMQMLQQKNPNANFKLKNTKSEQNNKKEKTKNLKLNTSKHKQIAQSKPNTQNKYPDPAFQIHKSQKQSQTAHNQVDFASTQTKPHENNMEAQKKMNSLFNKLSDGNLLITFRQFIKIFESYPKSTTFTIFASLFVKFNLLIQKPLIHVMAANSVIAAGLHRVYNDKFMAQILYELTQGFLKLQKEEQNLEQNKQIGYSKLFEKKRNYITLTSFLYDFNSVSGGFIQSIVSHLTNNIHNKENIELIYHLVQKCGVKLRNNDPGTLKQVIETLRNMIDDSKKDGTFQTTKVKFIEIQINEIRFNKKGLFDVDQRMRFMHNFLAQVIKKEVPIQQKTLDVTFSTFQRIQDTSKPGWWATSATQQQIEPDEDLQDQHKMRQLYDLAKSMQFVTEIKRNIFVELMSSHDYIQATKKLLSLKVKRLEDIATVLVEVSLQQNAFNPFYVLVACKIAEQIPKFRVSLQFAIWDRLKQVTTFTPRKISNLSKFSAWLISSQNANSSLTVLKYFPDLLSVKSQEDVYLSIFFKQLLKKCQRSWIIKLSNKLKQQKNRVIRDGIRDYLAEILPSLESQKQKSNAILLRKLVAAQFETEIQND